MEMIPFDKKLTPQEQAVRVDGVLELLHQHPLAKKLFKPEDLRMCAELALHAMDSTTEHLLGHVERANLVLSRELVMGMMLPLATSITRMQMTGMLEELKEKADELETKREVHVHAVKSPEELFAMLKELGIDLGEAETKQ